MKKLCLSVVLAVSFAILAGCSSSNGTVSVETQNYNENGGKLETDGWQKHGTVDAVQGEVVYTNGQITATVGNVSPDSMQIKFSEQVVNQENNKPGDIFKMEKNRTYTFIAGGGTNGLEIKLRYK